MNGIKPEIKSRHREGFLNSKEVCRLYQISPFTLRTWRRGWYSNSDGRHYFFKDKENLKHIWCKRDRQYEYDPIKLGRWDLRMKKKKHASAVAKGKIKKKITHGKMSHKFGSPCEICEKAHADNPYVKSLISKAKEGVKK